MTLRIGWHYLPGNADPEPALAAAMFLDLDAAAGMRSEQRLCRVYFKGRPEPREIAPSPFDSWNLYMNILGQPSSSPQPAGPKWPQRETPVSNPSSNAFVTMLRSTKASTLEEWFSSPEKATLSAPPRQSWFHFLLEARSGVA